MAARRSDIGSWLEGTPGGEGAGDGSAGPVRGRDLGLPADGPGSRAGVGRRVVGLGIDWALASLISSAFFGFDEWATLGVFAVSTAVLVSLLGTTIGHRVAGIQVVRLADLVTVAGDAARARRSEPVLPALLPPPGLLLGVVRTVLLCLVIPAVVWDGTGRGLHDVAAGTVLVRR
nr:RDD family protein [uncultured Actinotalea sp.]